MVGGWAGGLTASRWAAEHGLRAGFAEPTLFVCCFLPVALLPRPWGSASALHSRPTVWVLLGWLPCVPVTSFLRCLSFSAAAPHWPGGCALQGFASSATLCCERDHKASPQPPPEQVPAVPGIASEVAQGQRKPNGWAGSAGVSSCWSRPLRAVRLGIQ